MKMERLSVFNNIIIGDCFDELIAKTSKVLLEKGALSAPRGLKTLELLNTTLILTNPVNNLLSLKSRKYSMDYLMAELKWYKSCDLSVKMIEKHSSMWSRLKDGDGLVNSNYGFMVWRQTCPFVGSQFEWVIDRLVEDRDSRQAIINFNQVSHKYEGNKDFPCTLTAQFLIRDNKLNLIVNMRSNDLIYGTCYDVPFFTCLQKRVLDVLKEKDGFDGLVLGVYVHNVGSLHVYERHFSMLDELVKEDVFLCEGFTFDFKGAF